jgi:hypothetical protein
MSCPVEPTALNQSPEAQESLQQKLEDTVPGLGLEQLVLVFFLDSLDFHPKITVNRANQINTALAVENPSWVDHIPRVNV